MRRTGYVVDMTEMIANVLCVSQFNYLEIEGAAASKLVPYEEGEL